MPTKRQMQAKLWNWRERNERGKAREEKQKRYMWGKIKLLLTKLKDRADIYNLHELYMRAHLLSQSNLMFVVMRGRWERRRPRETDRGEEEEKHLLFSLFYPFFTHLFKKYSSAWNIGKWRLEKERQTGRRAGRKGAEYQNSIVPSASQ